MAETVQRFDAVELRLDKAERLDNGWLRVPATIGSVGVFEYYTADGKVVREYRPPEEVLDPASIASFEAVPLTNRPGSTTPRGFVDAARSARGRLATDVSPEVSAIACGARAKTTRLSTSTGRTGRWPAHATSAADRPTAPATPSASTATAARSCAPRAASLTTASPTARHARVIFDGVRSSSERWMHGTERGANDEDHDRNNRGRTAGAYGLRAQ